MLTYYTYLLYILASPALLLRLRSHWGTRGPGVVLIATHGELVAVGRFYLSEHLHTSVCHGGRRPPGNTVISQVFKVVWVDVAYLKGFFQMVFLQSSNRADALCFFNRHFLSVPSPPQHPLGYSALERVAAVP